MIVRMTVNDNDYGSVMHGFCSNFWNFVALGVDINDFDYGRSVRFRKMLNPNVGEKLTEEEKDELVKRVRQAFRVYISSRPNCEPKTVEYLMANLKVTVLDSFKDRWENGEAFYWLQHSGVVVNQ